jgi:hypothetical protein
MPLLECFLLPRQQLIAMLVHNFVSLAKLFATSSAPDCLDLTRPISEMQHFRDRQRRQITATTKFRKFDENVGLARCLSLPISDNG